MCAQKQQYECSVEATRMPDRCLGSCALSSPAKSEPLSPVKCQQRCKANELQKSSPTDAWPAPECKAEGSKKDAMLQSANPGPQLVCALWGTAECLQAKFQSAAEKEYAEPTKNAQTSLWRLAPAAPLATLTHPQRMSHVCTRSTAVLQRTGRASYPTNNYKQVRAKDASGSHFASPQTSGGSRGEQA